jgi:hypothetical protein
MRDVLPQRVSQYSYSKSTPLISITINGYD